MFVLILHSTTPPPSVPGFQSVCFFPGINLHFPTFSRNKPTFVQDSAFWPDPGLHIGLFREIPWQVNASPSALAPVVPRPRFATVDLRSDLHCHCVAVGRDRTCIRGLLTALGVKAPCSSPSQFEPSVMHVRLQRLSRPLLHDSGGAGGAWLHTSPLNPSTTFTAFTMLSQVVGLTTCDVGRSLAPLAASATALLAVPGRLRTIVRVQDLRRCVSTVLSTASLAASTQACAPPLQAHLLQQRDASARAGAAHLWQASWRVLPRGCPPPFRLRRLRRRRLLGLLDAPTPCGCACSTRRDRHGACSCASSVGAGCSAA